MDVEKKYQERIELIEIFNNLSLPLRKQLLTLARVIDTTYEITRAENKRKFQKKYIPVEE